MVGPRWAWVIVLLVFAAMVVAVYGPALPRWAVVTVWLAPSRGMSAEGLGERMVGVVQAGQFVPLDPRGGGVVTVQLTAMPMQAARAPESERIDLGPYEGQAIAIWGHPGGGWVYSAQVEGPLDPISALLVRWGL